MNLRTWIILGLLLATASSGCSYLEARGEDFLDCFKVSAGAGLGANYHVQVGPLSHGFGFWVGCEAGVLGKKRAWAWYSTYGGFLLGHMDANTRDDVLLNKNPAPWDGNILSSSSILFLTLVGDKDGGFMFWPESSHHWADYFWVEVQARVLLGIRIGFNVAEFADFILGWFGLDLCDDDNREYRP